MKRIVFATVLFFSGAAYSQEGQGRCKKCTTGIYNNFLKEYLKPETYPLIMKNFGEYFISDLDTSKIRFGSNPTHLFSLKFDKLGCAYPDSFPDSLEAFKHRKKRFSYRKNLSFLKVYSENNWDPDGSHGKSAFGVLQDQITWKDKNLAVPKLSKFLLDDPSQYLWIKEWNEKHLEPQVQQINESLIKNNIKRIVFLVHGYNVPYSIGQIQYNNLIDIFKEELKPEEFDKTMFIKVFWPGTAGKKIKKKEDVYVIKNRIRPGAVKRYNEVTVRSYMVSLSLRKVLNQLNGFNGDILMAGHSMGCPTITSALIDPGENLRETKKPKAKRKQETNKKLKLLKEQFSKENPVAKDYSPKIRVFLNAPAMSGINSFYDPESGFKNVNWTIGFNPTDRVLNKTFTIFRFGDEYGNTRLGGNWEDEAWKTKDYLRKYGDQRNYQDYLDRFEFVQTGVQHDLFGHDFFCYLLQEKFKFRFGKFIK